MRRMEVASRAARQVPMEADSHQPSPLGPATCQGSSSSQQRGLPQRSVAAGSWVVLSFAVTWNPVHRYPFLLGDGGVWGIQEHQPPQLCLPTSFHLLTAWKGTSEGSQAVFSWLPEDKYGLHTTLETLDSLKPRNYKQENSFLRNNLTPFLRQKVLAWNILPLQFNCNHSFKLLKKLCL